MLVKTSVARRQTSKMTYSPKGLRETSILNPRVYALLVVYVAAIASLSKIVPWVIRIYHP